MGRSRREGRTSAADPDRPVPRSPARLVGMALLLLGTLSLGWAGCQLVGTDVVAEQHFVAGRDQLREQWRPALASPPVSLSASPSNTPSHTPAATTLERTAAPSASPSGTPSVAPPEQTAVPRAFPGEAIALLRVPAFGAGYEVPVLAGTDDDTLTRGVGHYEGTALPGQVGNFAVAGHRVTHGEPFSRLLELDAGDTVLVETRDAVHTYVVDRPPRELTVPDAASWVLDPVPGKSGTKATKAILTLTTCQDLFPSDDRSVGFARLQHTAPKR